MKPKNRIKIIAIIITIVVIAITLLILFFFTDIFRTKKGAFLRYFKTTTKSLEILDERDNKDYYDMKKTMPYIRNAEMIITSSNNVADSSIMDKIKISLTGKTNYKTENSNYEVSIKSQNQELAFISLIKEKNKYAFYSPQISNGYIGIKNENLKELLFKLGIDEYIPDEINEIKIDKFLEETKVEQSHIENYYNIFKNNTADSSYSKKKNSKVKIDDKSYSTTEYALNLSSNESADLQIALLTKLSQDSIMMDFITSKARLINIDNYFSDINGLNAKMKERIERFKTNPETAEEMTITVNEYKQKNLKTTIKIKDNIISFYHIKEDDTQTSIYGINNIELKVQKTKDEYIVKITNREDDIEKYIEIKHKIEGSLQDNNIKNIMEITHGNGIKNVTYSYSDSLTFTNDIGSIKDLSGETVAILNDYSKDNVEPFVTSLKNKINDVYREKGASIGINLDPIFEVE